MFQWAQRLAKDLAKLSGYPTVKQIDKEIKQGNVFIVCELMPPKETTSEDGHVAELTVAKLTKWYWTLFYFNLNQTIFFQIFKPANDELSHWAARSNVLHEQDDSSLLATTSGHHHSRTTSASVYRFYRWAKLWKNTLGIKPIFLINQWFGLVAI